jgi:hypothetical protein
VSDLLPTATELRNWLLILAIWAGVTATFWLFYKAFERLLDRLEAQLKDWPRNVVSIEDRRKRLDAAARSGDRRSA